MAMQTKSYINALTSGSGKKTSKNLNLSPCDRTTKDTVKTHSKKHLLPAHGALKGRPALACARLLRFVSGQCGSGWSQRVDR